MKVAIDARLLGGTATGDSTYWTCLIPALLRSDPELSLVLISNATIEFPDSPRVEKIIHSGPGRVFSLVVLPRLALQSGADLLHVQYSLPLRSRLPVVTTIHDVSFLIGPEWFSPRDRMLLRLGAVGAAHRAARIITVSETSREEIERLLPAAKGRVDVALNACPPWIRAVEPSIARGQVEALGITEPYALTVGTRWARKNMELAIRTADAVGTPLVVTGKAGAEGGLGDRGIATGYVDADTLSALYSAADLTLVPSRHEGYGLTVVEAFRCGSPVLTTGAGALREVGGDAAVHASEAEWPATLAALLVDRSRLAAMRGAGIERERLFTWDASARATLESYRRALS